MRLKAIGIFVVSLVALLTYTKVIWQSAYDAGGDATQCLIASYAKSGGAEPDMTDGGCRRIGQYEHNPLWALRRRNGPSPQ